MNLFIRNLVFSVVVPGLGGGYVPWLILSKNGRLARPTEWYPMLLVAGGLALYICCVWVFGSKGRGTPGIWDPPRHVVTVGPYRWVRNPIYVGALVIISGEAWMYSSVDLLIYVGSLAVAFHLLVIIYEEPRLRRHFGEEYKSYCRVVSRWVPRRVSAGQVNGTGRT
ncbi:MAG: isoprenylcysteine carboxylmethyltransferase family protein [Acidimicrobiaceae bacterium]|nr:isoprenylcysteine carboxylmethyltransferase family protein [Acidimicrobiaceae bacterium]